MNACTISAFLYFGNYDFDITNEVGAYYYNWTRHEQGNETLVYTVVSSTTGKNPMREGWFVKSGEQYLPTFDTTPQGGTTYYARSSSITYTPQDDAAVMVFHQQDSLHMHRHHTRRRQ